jgi:hypothetical protein
MDYIENIFRSSHTTTCHICGGRVFWADSDFIGGDTEDDRFSGVMEKLKYHQENDTACIREQKLKVLLSNE